MLSLALGGPGVALAAPDASQDVAQLRARLTEVQVAAAKREAALAAENAELRSRAEQLTADYVAATTRLERSTKTLEAQLDAVKRTAATAHLEQRTKALQAELDAVKRAVDDEAASRAADVAAAARSASDRRAARQLLGGVAQQLVSGDTDGVDAALTAAAGLTQGTTAHEDLDAARTAIGNEDLARARDLVSLALVSLGA